MKMDYSLNREALYETIANKLEQMILNDSTQIDQRLPSEQVLAISFGVSRPVIREALKLLKERGLINQKQGGRTVICEPDSSLLTSPINRLVQLKNVSTVQIFEVRMALELLSAQSAAERATESDLAELRELNRQMEQQSGDPAVRARCDLAFHKRLAEISENPLLLVFIESIGELLTEMIRVTLKSVHAGTDGVSFHEKIVRSLETHDPQKAENIMREHLMLSMRNYEFSIREQKEE